MKNRLIIKTKDNIIMGNRKIDPQYYFFGGAQNDEFIEYVIKVECRERGVKEISHNVDSKNCVITVIADWL